MRFRLQDFQGFFSVSGDFHIELLGESVPDEVPYLLVVFHHEKHPAFLAVDIDILILLAFGIDIIHFTRICRIGHIFFSGICILHYFLFRID